METKPSRGHNPNMGYSIPTDGGLQRIAMLCLGWGVYCACQYSMDDNQSGFISFCYSEIVELVLAMGDLQP